MHHSRRKDKEIQRVADTMVRFFQSYGVKVMRYDAYSTSSIYLKLDYGLLYTMRISDHRGKKHLGYRYNIIKGYRGRRYQSTKWGWNREFIPINRNDLNEMCLTILQMRAKKICSVRVYGYQEWMDHKRERNAHNKGFWQQAKDLG